MKRTSARQRGKSTSKTTGRFGRRSRRDGPFVEGPDGRAVPGGLVFSVRPPFNIPALDRGAVAAGKAGPGREGRGRGTPPRGSGKIPPPLLPTAPSAYPSRDSRIRPRTGGALPSRSGGDLRAQDGAASPLLHPRPPATGGDSATLPADRGTPCSPSALPRVGPGVTTGALWQPPPGQPH